MIDRLFDALALPASARMERRVPKAMLAEHGATGAGDRKLVDTGIERLRWRATLKPATIGVPALTGDTRDYAEIAVLTMETRDGTNIARLARITHGAIPYPLILITGTANTATISVAPKRRHERRAGHFVIERLVMSPDLSEPVDSAAAAFEASLTVADLPAASLWSLYEGMIDRIDAYAAARITSVFRLLTNAQGAEARRTALGAHDAQVREVARLRKFAAAEKRLSMRVALSHTIIEAEAELHRLTQLLV